MDLASLIAVNSVLTANELSYNELLVLGYIADNPGTTVTPVSLVTHLQPAVVSRTLNMLEEREMVDRTLDTGDKRRLCLRLTTTGEKFCEKVRRELRDALTKAR